MNKNRHYDSGLRDFLQSVFGGYVMSVNRIAEVAQSLHDRLPATSFEEAFAIECSGLEKVKVADMQLEVLGEIIGMYFDTHGCSLRSSEVCDGGLFSADIVIHKEEETLNLIARISVERSCPVLRVVTRAYALC